MGEKIGDATASKGVFRKKPVQVKAWQLPAVPVEHDPEIIKLPDWVEALLDDGRAWYPCHKRLGPMHIMVIHTLEGSMKAQPLDWLIQGIHGEVYPCKPNIFAESYEPIPASVEAP